MRRGFGTAAILFALCVCVFAQAYSSLRVKSLTFDELSYLAAGYSYVKTGDFRLNQEQPPLMKLLAGAALLPANPHLPIEHGSWTDVAEGAANTQWEFGRVFLIEANDNGEDLVRMARIPTVFVTMLLVVVAFLFARDLYGRQAGFLAAALCAFCPNLLAHGRLVTTDLGLACFVLLATYTYHRFTRAPSTWSLLVAGAALGLALLTKFSAVLLLPLLGLWAVVLPLLDDGMIVPDEGWPRRVENRGARRLAFSLASAAAIVLVALFIVSLGYGALARPDLYFRDLRMVGANTQPAFLTYFNGTFHDGRVPHYFLAAFALKTPLAFLLLLAARVGLDVARSASAPGRRSATLAPGPAEQDSERRDDNVATRLLLFSPIALWLLVISAQAFQIGLRYILPVYPLLFVYTGGIVVSPLFERRWFRVAMAGLVAWFALSSLRAHPHYLPYFNELAGGPERGIEWLDDSNVDWGQDLILLRDFLRASDFRDVTVTPMANYDPALYGIHANRLTPHEMVQVLIRPDPPPGVYAVSAHVLNRSRLYASRTVDPMTELEPIAILGHTIYVFSFP